MALKTQKPGIRYCPICNEPTNYDYYKKQYNKYCKNHWREAKAEQGKQRQEEGSFDPGWRKGLNKENNTSIAAQALKISGKGNPFYGKKHSDETRKRMAQIKQETEPLKLSKEEFESRLTRTDLIFLGTYEDYEKRIDKNLKFKCVKCGEEFIMSLLFYEEGVRCPGCRENSSKRPEVREKISASLRMTEEEFIDKAITNNKSDFIVLETYENYKSQGRQKLSVKCKQCGAITRRTLGQINEATQCHSCHPDSKEEQQIKVFLEGLGVDYISNSREIIPPLELDIFVPEHNLAIEYNGLYWHCENKKDKFYHSEKTRRCNESGISLMHVFSDEYLEKPRIIESMIRDRLKRYKFCIPAEECEIARIQDSEEETFFNKNHIFGYIKSDICFALIKNKELVAALSADKTGKILRFAVLLNVGISGAFEKLLKSLKEYCLASYINSVYFIPDLRMDDIGPFETSGFTVQLNEELDYWYTNGKEKFHPLMFNGQVLDQELDQYSGLFRIYGCNSCVCKLKL